MLCLKHIFRRIGSFSTLQMRFISQASPSNPCIENVFIIGTDLMACEIAQSCALANKFKSIVIADPELSQQELLDVHKKICENLTKTSKKKKIKHDENFENLVNQITTTNEYFPNHDRNLLVIESLGSDLEMKQKVLKDLSTHFKENKSIIITSDNSNWQINTIGKDIEDKRRYAGLSFFSPVEDTMKVSEFIIMLTLGIGFKSIIYPDLFVALDRACQRIAHESTLKWQFYKHLVETFTKRILFKNLLLNTLSGKVIPSDLRLSTPLHYQMQNKFFELSNLFLGINFANNSFINIAKQRFIRIFPESTIKITCTGETSNATLKLLQKFVDDIGKAYIVNIEKD